MLSFEKYCLYWLCCFGLLLSFFGFIAAMGHGDFLGALFMGAIAFVSFHGAKGVFDKP